jgi:hypothetical protein
LRNVAFEMGANLETKNSSFAPAERTLYIGPKFVIAMPKGYFNVGFHFRKEWNHEGVLGKLENYTPDFNIEPNWMSHSKSVKCRLHLAALWNTTLRRGRIHLEATVFRNT